jgi:hypothetical protein
MKGAYHRQAEMSKLRRKNPKLADFGAAIYDFSVYPKTDIICPETEANYRNSGTNVTAQRSKARLDRDGTQFAVY